MLVASRAKRSRRSCTATRRSWNTRSISCSQRRATAPPSAALPSILWWRRCEGGSESSEEKSDSRVEENTEEGVKAPLKQQEEGVMKRLVVRVEEGEVNTRVYRMVVVAANRMV